MIEIEHVEKSFKDVKVLKDVSLKCEPGKIYGIVGRNGSGKTVLFKCICGFLKCDSGEIRVDGKIVGKDLDMLKNSGIIIEEPGFLRKMSGYRNLEYLYTIRNRKDRDYIKRIMETVGLDPNMKKSVGKYSLGMRQRLAIAQAIMEKPDILILDEPLNGLDKTGAEEFRNLFLTMRNEGKLILIATHNKEDIDMLCDKVYEMDAGYLTELR